MSEQRVTIHTDGACSGNPGPGGWGAMSSLLLLTNGNAVSQALFKSLPYDPTRDYTPVAMVCDSGPFVVAPHRIIPGNVVAGA